MYSAGRTSSAAEALDILQDLNQRENSAHDSSPEENRMLKENSQVCKI